MRILKETTGGLVAEVIGAVGVDWIGGLEFGRHRLGGFGELALGEGRLVAGQPGDVGFAGVRLRIGRPPIMIFICQCFG